jgi:hypothetical protein
MSFAKYINKMYTDKLTVIRYVEIDNEDGTTGVSADPSEELKDIPCRISTLKEDEKDLSNWDIDETMGRVKIFLSPDIRIYKGDEVIADRYINGVKVQSYKGNAGDPMIYDLAQEFILLEKRVKNAS